MRRLLAAAIGMMSVTMWSPQVEAANSIVVVDPDGVTGATSLALDVSGRPVVAYHDATNGQLKLVHCNDRNCSGGDESRAAVDSDGDVGSDASLALDAAGNPVVAYYDATNGHLRIAHCNDPNCSGGNESVVAVDRSGTAGVFTSLELDGAGNPVVSYHDFGNFDLKLVHCNDPNCAGDDESIVTVDSSGDLGSDTSLVLDATGNPVVSYHDFGNLDLKLVHCNDPYCSGGGESIETVDNDGSVGMFTSLALDATGDPVVSYYDATNHDLELVHCNDRNCSGADESVVALDRAGNVGWYTSLDLDAAGDPVVSYHDATNGDLKVAHCNDTDCADADEQINTVDGLGEVGFDTSMRLDNGTPVISYGDLLNDDLKLARCDNTICAPVTCQGAGATIVGTAGSDVIVGTAGDDVIFAGAGDDTVDGLAGNDIVCGGGGRDTIDGGDGDDRLYGFSNLENADAGDTMNGGAGDDFLDGGPGDDDLAGGTGDDHLAGGEADSDDVLAGGPGDDLLVGEGGIDTLSYATSSAAVSASLTTNSATGDGTDELFDFENVIGSPFDDTLVGDSGANTIQGLDGDDVLDGAAGVDTVSYAASGVSVSANLATRTATADGRRDVLAGFENLVGSVFNDSLVGDERANTILGLDGDDGLDGATGDDRLDSGAGNDVIFGSPGDDLINGAAGLDNLNFARSTAGVNADLSEGRVTGEGADRVAAVEHLGGTEFDDVLKGNAGSNTIGGGGGNDVIVGGRGDDVLFGDDGADRLDGGRGDDFALGGRGADTMTGGAGGDTLRGSDEGARGPLDRGDRISGGRGEDLIDGGIGNDALAGGPGDDHLSGGGGFDTVTYADAAVGVSARLRTHRASGEGNDALFEFENVVGSRFGDVLTGSSRANSIRGGRGDDRLAGLAGNDALNGGAGFDRGNGGAGSDTQRRCEATAEIP